MSPSKDEALEPFYDILNRMVPMSLVKNLQAHGYKEGLEPQTLRDVLSWAYDTLQAMFVPLDTLKPSVKVVCYNKKLDGVNFEPKAGKTLIEAIFDSFNYLIAIYLIENHEDYYFPED